MMFAPHSLPARALALAAAMALGALTLPAPGVLAHEHREVGNYELVVGFLNEPAYAGLLNGLDLRVTRKAAATPQAGSDEEATGGEPVVGLDQTLRVEVIKGGAAMPLTLEPRFRQPGAYAAYFFPTEPGAYTFHITGSIEGQAIDERFTSGPTTFSEIEEPGALQFPTRLPSAAEMQARLAALEQQVAELKQRLQQTGGAGSGG